MTRVLNKEEVETMTSLCHQTIWRMEKLGQFPERIQISAKRVGWLQSEVVEWLEAKSKKTKPQQDESLPVGKR